MSIAENRMDASEVKAAAAGKWSEILPAVTGIDRELLDGKNHPCPKCPEPGKDRFRMIDDAAGALYCNQCNKEKNGDGFSAIQWYTGCTFPEAVGMVAKYLHLEHGNGNGHNGNGNGKTKAEDKAARLAASIAKLNTFNDEQGAPGWFAKYAASKPPINVEGIRKCGGQVVNWFSQFCIRFDGRVNIGDEQPAAVVLLRADGKPFPATGQLQERKSHSLAGSVNAWITSGDVEAADVVLDVEGIPDLLAAASMLPTGKVAVTNTGGASTRGKLSRKWAKGKRIIVLGDADQPGQEGLRRAVLAYSKAGAIVEAAELPYPVEETHGKDLRDWLNEGHRLEDLPTAPVEDEQVEEWSKASKSRKRDEDPGMVKLLADMMLENEHFAQDAGGKLYRYHDGVFRADGEQFVKRQVKKLMVAFGWTKGWKNSLTAEVVEFIRVDSSYLPDCPRVDLINVENGMVRVADGVLLPHDPQYLSVVQLPIKYDPAATCPNIEKFVATTFPADAHSLAWEIPGVLMVPIMWLQKAVLLLGEGSNGKSVWLSLLVRFLDKRNVASIPLHRLETDKFSVARLVGKLANICADLPSEHLAGTSMFKAIVGGDTLTAERKFKDSFEFDPFVRLVFSANHPPRSQDSSAGFFRRWVVIPFDRTFAGKDIIPRDVLDAQLQAPAELSGLLNKALDGLRRVQRQRGLSEPESIQAAWRDFHATTDPLAVWLDRYTIDDPGMIVPKQAIRTAFNGYVERSGRPPMTAKAFGQALYKLRPSIQEAQRMHGGKLQWCYIGIGLAYQGSESSPNCSDDSQDSRDSRDSRICYQSRDPESNKGKEEKCNSAGRFIYDNTVNPVNAVNDPAACQHDWVDTEADDGRLKRTCCLCGKFYGYVKAR